MDLDRTVGIVTNRKRNDEVTQTDSAQADSTDVNAAILNAVRGIRFGSVEIVIHDAKVVQIECKEKIRLMPR